MGVEVIGCRTSRWMRIGVEVVGIAIMVWMLLIAWDHAHAQSVQQQVELHGYQLDTLLKTDGIVDQINDHLRNTDKAVAALNDLANKLVGGLIALGSLQTVNLCIAALTGKKAR